MNPFIIIFSICSFCSLVYGVDFTSARITKIQNNVEVLDMANPKTVPAQVNQTITGENGVRTGIKSRAELKFNDNTLTRIGANTLFSFKEGQREVLLNRGTMLFQVPKDAGGMKVTTAAVTAAITGTTGLVETNSKSFSKFIILEGSARVFLNNRVGESMLLKPGKMLILPPNAKNLPQPVDINIRKIFKTSGLIQGMPEEPPPPPDGDQPPPPSPDGTLPPPPDGTLADGQLPLPPDGDLADGALPPPPDGTLTDGRLPPPPDNTLGLDTTFIDQAIVDQDRQISDGLLAPTPLRITGSGTTVEFVAQDTGDIVDTTQTSTDTNPENPDNQQTLTTPLVSFPSGITSLQNGDSYDLDIPSFTQGGNTYVGGFYEGAPIDPPPASYLFGVTSGFDSRSNINADIRDPMNFDIRMSAFRFSASTLMVNAVVPTVSVDTRTNGTAIVNENSMTINNVPNLGSNHLLFATVNGALSLNSFYYNANNKAMMFHARGIGAYGNLDVNCDLDYLESVKFSAENSLTINSSSDITANGIPAVDDSNDISIYSDRSIQLNGPRLDAGVDTSRHGHIDVKVGLTTNTGTTIHITNTSQLHAYADAVKSGQIYIEARSGNILLDGMGNTLEAHSSGGSDYSSIEMRNMHDSGLITLNPTSGTNELTADILKIGALNGNGNVTIGRSNLDAGHIMKIYGGSSNGSVIFTQNTTLSGNSLKTIAAPTVTVQSSATVTVIGGALNVFADTHNYGVTGDVTIPNGSYGNFDVTTTGADSFNNDFADRPGF